MKRFVLAFLMFSTPCLAGIINPIYLGNAIPAKDSFGKNLMSSCLVEIRTAEYGIFNPSRDGISSPYNPPVYANSSAGMGLNAVGANSGLFCIVYPLRLPTGLKVFARAYNAPTIGQSTFYSDSQFKIVPDDRENTIILEFGAMKPLDEEDADEDGLNNSWEELLGIDDRETPDYDQDGASDYEEMLAGTAPDDPDSIFTITSVKRDSEGYAEISWKSVPDKKYVLECSPSLEGAEGFSQVEEAVVATQFKTSKSIKEPRDSRNRFFRVRIQN